MATADSDLDLLTPQLRSRSASEREIVLRFEEAIASLWHFRVSNVGIVGWEGWLIRSDGTKTHSSFQGTSSVTPSLNEVWNEYVSRSLNYALETIQQSQRAFGESSEAASGELLFCITPLTEREWRQSQRKTGESAQRGGAV